MTKTELENFNLNLRVYFLTSNLYTSYRLQYPVGDHALLYIMSKKLPAQRIQDGSCLIVLGIRFSPSTKCPI